jgi:MoxR-like ATPase
MAISHQELLQEIRSALALVIRGKETAVERALVAMLAGGHILLEDVPGVGKTTLAKALARVWNLDFARVQFTPDLLPTDILGMNVLDPRDGSFSFRPGPIFHQILLADEINRASPRTQSALLEAMNEGQVTLDNVTRPLPAPFFVAATQNPVDYQGTYPLPEAQLDRFLFRISLGYPALDDEMNMLFDRQTTDPLAALLPLADAKTLSSMQAEVRGVRVSDDVGKYILHIVEETRRHSDIELGASPRASLALFRAAQGHAFLSGRSWAGPLDVQAAAEPVLAHRMLLTVKARYSGSDAAHIIKKIVESVEVPA